MNEESKSEQSKEAGETPTISSSQSKSTTKLEDIIIIGNEEVTIHKLKAGEFYKLQGVFGEILKAAASSAEDVEKMNPDQLGGLFIKIPEHTAEFVAICAQMPKEELLEKAYPEEIAEAFGKGLALNNVVENLKNSVAPMEKLGALVAK
jgi:hypothetical protein